MEAVDFRNETWEGIRGRVSGLREAVYRAWLSNGPGTTRAVALRSGIDLLTFRPRTTELVEIGAVECIGGEGGNGEAGKRGDGGAREGVYRAREVWEWAKWCEQKRVEAVSRQLQLL